MVDNSIFKYRPDIDGLRAVAVLSVLFYHAYPSFFRSGYVGVDIFFVISGFLITTIIRKEVMRNDFSLLTFYKKRIKRIYPSLIIVLLFVIFFSWFLLSTTEFSLTLKHVIFSSLFAENFLLWSEDGYFDKLSIFKPTLHIWSLSIEEQFYIFWPLIVIFLVKRKIEFQGILFFIFLSFLINLYDIENHPAAAYYSPLGRSWELMVGSLAAVVNMNGYNKSINNKTKSILSTLGFVLIFLSVFMIPSQQNFPGFYAIPVVLASALIILFSQENYIGKILSIKYVVFVGLISYPLYLVHWPIMSFISIILGHSSTKANLISLFFSFCIATAIYIFVEKPISKKNLSISYRLFVIMLFVPFISFCLINSSSRLGEIKISNENEWVFLKNNHKKFGLEEFHNNGTGIYNLSVKGGSSSIFIGDSHIANLAEYIYGVVGNKDKLRVSLAAGGGCIPIPDVYTDDKRRSSCWSMRDSSLARINSGEFNSVVFGGAWYMYFYNKKDYFIYNDGKKIPLASSLGRELAINRLMKEISQLTSKGISVYFIKDAPYISDVTPGIYKMRLQPFISSNMDKDSVVSIDKAQLSFIDHLESKAKLAGANIINVFDNVCHKQKCVIFDHDQYVYSDPGHFNPSWLRENAKILSDIKL